MRPRDSFDEYAEYGEYGYHGNDAGCRALGVLAGLSEPASDLVDLEGRPTVWSKDDFWVFENFTELETGIRFIEPHSDVDGSEIGDLHRTFGRLHISLPLCEVERYWLFAPLGGKSERDQRSWDIHRPESLLGVAEEVTSGGLKQVVQGREVVRRLAAWRRETDEFAGQGTLDEAREALGQIATTLVQPKNWPREHEDLRDQYLGDS